MSFERICEAIKFDGLSINSVAVVTGIPQSSLQRFCTGQQGLQMDGLLKVCEFLGLELVRRFDADELKEHMDNGWSEVKADIETEEYATPKTEAWHEHAAEQWKAESGSLWTEYATENELDVDDNDEYLAWETDSYQEWADKEYETWSTEYDEENYSEWEAEAYSEWEAEERERLESCEWIVITE